MLPSNDLLTSLEMEEIPSKIYKMNIKENIINGYVDELESVRQTVYKILNTERYEYIIYSWNYGIELSDLIGKPIGYVCAELERRIKEALLQDDRINSIDNFEFNYEQKNIINVSFCVNTIYGTFETEKEVNY